MKVNDRYYKKEMELDKAKNWERIQTKTSDFVSKGR